MVPGASSLSPVASLNGRQNEHHHYIDDKDDAEGGQRGRRTRIFAFLTDAESSQEAKIYSWYLDVLVIVSLLTFCFESLPSLTNSPWQRIAWFVGETYITCNFILDFVLKVATQPSLGAYLPSWDALIDLLSIIPWGFDLYRVGSQLSEGFNKNYSSLRLLRLLRFIRFFRITLGNFPRMNLFWRAVQRSTLALLFLAIYVFGAGLFFSGCLYYTETRACIFERAHGRWIQKDAPPGTLCNIQSMFDAIWLCIVTMATVGYGDLVPRTAAGRVVSALLMITSMIFLPLPASIFGANLTELYLEERLAKRLDRRRAARQAQLKSRGSDSETEDRSSLFPSPS